ncbi:MAG TPA: hypothetical protein GXZ47_10580 [Treponema sp.]|nr:hypothetical protein [Treponema sp.]
MGNRLENVTLTDRRVYSIFILSIKGLKGSKLEKAISFKLVTIFPGNIENYAFDYKRNGNEKDSYIVFVISKVLSQNAQYLSTLVIKNNLRIRQGSVCFIDHDWFEVCTFSNWVLKSTYVKNMDSASFTEELSSLSGDGCEHIYIIRSKRDTRFSEAYSSVDQATIIFREDLFVSIDNDAIFIRKSSEYLRKRKLYVVLLFLIFIGCLSVTVRYHEVVRQRDFQNRQSEIRSGQQRKEQAELVATKTRLHDEFTALLKTRAVYPFDVMQLVATTLDSKTQILSATFMNGFFQIEAVAQDALQVLQCFEKNHMISNSIMRSVSMVKGVELFSLSGSVEPSVSKHVENNDVNKEIEKLKILIKEENKANEFSFFESRSDYAATIRRLLQENQCVVNRYNFIQTGNGEEIEYSVIATNDSIAKFLTFANREPTRFKFTQIQIRNLTPTYALDVTLRIQTPVFASPIESFAASKRIDFTLSRIFEIKKNYYALSERKQASHLMENNKENLSGKPRLSLTYIGAITGEMGNQYIYTKLHSGDILAFLLGGQGTMSCKQITDNTYEARIESELYEIKRGE